MGILVRSENERSELQKQISANLRAKIASSSDDGIVPQTDLSYDTAIAANLKRKSTFPFIRAVVFFTTALLITIIFFVI